MKVNFSQKKCVTSRILSVIAVALMMTGNTQWMTLSAQAPSPGNLLLSRTVYDGSAPTVTAGSCAVSLIAPVGQSQTLPGAVVTKFIAAPPSDTANSSTTGTVSSASGFSVANGPVQVSITRGGTPYTVCLTGIVDNSIKNSKDKTFTFTWSPALPSAVTTTDTILPLASADGSFPGVWANETPDASFGVTSPIYLDQMPSDGSDSVLNSVAVDSTKIVTSFSSKSEMGLNLSPDGKYLTFMGYDATENQLDVSNSNTAGHVDSTNPVTSSFPREVAQLDPTGSFLFTPVNTYSGNNGRAAILANAADGPRYYTVGNAGNGGSPEPLAVINNTGVQTTTPGGGPNTTVIGQPRATTGTNCTTDPVSSNGCQFGFSIVDVGGTADKSGKDDNFRGITIFNNTVYVTKGSGSNGVDTVYQVGTQGTLPTAATASTTPIAVLNGLPTAIAKTAGKNNIYPFAMWFADSKTLYVADEGDGVAADSATSPYGGLQKWVSNSGTWSLAYVLQSGLNLGVPYNPPVAGYPLGLNPSPAGLRNLTGRRNDDGTVTIWAVTSTTSANTDQGADPNQLVMTTDTLSNTDPSAAANEAFTVVRTAQYKEVFRGVSFTPGTINPVWTVSALPAPNSSGWNNTTVTVSLTAAVADPTVPVQSIQYTLTGSQNQAQTAGNNPASFVVNADGQTSVSYFAQNAVGSRNASRSFSLRIDQTPPVITFSGNAGSYTVDQTINITCTASDALSGIASSSCPAASGPAYTFPLGPNTLNATATDVAGNMANKSANFTVGVTFDSLANLTMQFVQQHGIANSLVAKLSAAADAASRGDLSAKAGELGAYANEVSAQSGKALTPAQAATLIQLASKL